MNEWLGIVGYSLKETIMTVASKFATNLDMAQTIAGHRSQAYTKRYTRANSIDDLLNFTKRLVVPGLAERFGLYNDSAVPQPNLGGKLSGFT